ERLTDRVGRPLEPLAPVEGLLGREDVDETLRERGEPVGLVDVAMQAGAVELREDVDSIDARVEAVADRNVDQPELAAHGNRRFRPIARERPEASALAATQNGRNDSVFHGCPL